MYNFVFLLYYNAVGGGETTESRSDSPLRRPSRKSCLTVLQHEKLVQSCQRFCYCTTRTYGATEASDSDDQILTFAHLPSHGTRDRESLGKRFRLGRGANPCSGGPNFVPKYDIVRYRTLGTGRRDDQTSIFVSKL